MTTTDTQIVDELQADATTGFESLYQAYSERLFGYAITIVKDRDLAADVTHNALLRAVGNVSSLRNPERLRPWLFSITRNEAISALRVQNKWSDDEEAIDMLSVTPDFGRSLEAEDAQQLVHEALNGMSPKDRDVLSLALRNDLDADEVAAALGTSSNQARASISRARAALTGAVTALLLTRQRTDCPGLAEAIKGLDGFLTPLMRKRVARHVRDCSSCEELGEKRALSYVSGFALPVAVALPAGFAAKAKASVSAMEASGSFPPLGPTDEAGFPLPPSDADVMAAPTQVHPAIQDYEPEAATASLAAQQARSGQTWQKAAVVGVGAVVAGGILFLALRPDGEQPLTPQNPVATESSTPQPSGSRSGSPSPTTSPTGTVSPSPTQTSAPPSSASPTSAPPTSASPTSPTPTPTQTTTPSPTESAKPTVPTRPTVRATLPSIKPRASLPPTKEPGPIVK